MLCVLLSAALTASAQRNVPDAQLQSDAQKQLHGKEFRDVQVQVANGVVTLSGQVDRLSAKLDAEKKVAKTHEAASINNEIKIANVADVSDQQLYQKIGKALVYDRQGYGTQPFNALTVQVQNGVVTLGGEVVEPADKDSAIGIITNTPGVRGLEDHLKVAPVSPDDWRLRHALYAAVYGASQLNKYAIDPAKPIRIVVDNGHATLVGVVQNSGDREVAGIRANGVPGLFSVTNDLQVEGANPER